MMNASGLSLRVSVWKRFLNTVNWKRCQLEPGFRLSGDLRGMINALIFNKMMAHLQHVLLLASDKRVFHVPIPFPLDKDLNEVPIPEQRI